jgi:hypothetical protein
MNDDLKLQKIREILLREWDPAGVGDNPKLNDEYDNYLAEILRLIDNGSDYGQLCDHFLYIEKDLGIQLPNEQRAKTVDALLKLRSAG